MQLKNFTLLYVEDDVDAQEKVKMMLEDDVKEFYQAYNGQEGLALYEEKNPDIILTDINMPLLDGLSMSKEIKQKNPDKPIVVMSAFDDKETLLQAIDIGIDCFTPKPIDIDIVNEKLQEISHMLHHQKEEQEREHKELQNLYHLAHHDILTDLPNKFLFDIRLEEALSRAKREHTNLTLFFIDLDNFKSINDTYGHAAGDAVLKNISQSIQKVIRLEDTFARISGDEFSLILENVADNNTIEDIANKILQASCVKTYYKNHIISVSASIGISKFNDKNQSKEELLNSADSAMYLAKKDKKATFRYSA